MEFWYSGEIDASAHEAYSIARKRVEKILNEQLGPQTYGPALTSIALIPIIRKGGSTHRTERRLFQRGSSSADYRLHIPYQAFLGADSRTREQLLARIAIEAVDDVARKANLANLQFDGQRLRNDILRVLGMTEQDLERIKLFAA